MINGNKVIAVIPARGGSKGIPYKNIKNLNGKPLIAWTIGAAQSTSEIDRIVVSTDDEKIANVAREYNAEVIIRPSELAQDHSLMIDTIRDIITKLSGSGELDGYKYMVLLQPTSPLRESLDISNCLQLLANEEHNYDSIATFTEAELNPHRAWKIENNVPEVFIDGAIPWLQRQQLPNAYQLNGAVYAFKIDKIMNTNNISFLFGNAGSVTMPKERSMDIDNELQWKLTELLLEEKSKIRN